VTSSSDDLSHVIASSPPSAARRHGNVMHNDDDDDDVDTNGTTRESRVGRDRAGYGLTDSATRVFTQHLSAGRPLPVSDILSRLSFCHFLL